ncbi:hypothetical protein U9M48_031616 [Paspalum notatum var. saurae]|uniref:Uncharacterized protein n=1 Tax=Paspalum notatum var. saurae TaxID=547442 RepID=A0AAQ3U3H4_PASNO
MQRPSNLQTAMSLARAFEHLRVKVANGDRIPSTGLYVATDDEAFSLGFFVLALDGFDIVLVVHWLMTLGPIIWDLSTLTMAFYHHGRAICWQAACRPLPSLQQAAHAPSCTVLQPLHPSPSRYSTGGH